MGNTHEATNQQPDRSLCTPQQHFKKDKFTCMTVNCNVKPYICHNCAYQSKHDAETLICKLCCTTERMEDFDFDSIEIQPEDANSNNFKLVASVSYDRQKNAFHYSKGFEKHFGANAHHMM